MLPATVEVESPLKDSERPELWKRHVVLAHFNRARLSPQKASEKWRSKMESDFQMLLLEGELLEEERAAVSKAAAVAPQRPREFIKWFEALRDTGPGQNDPLFEALSTRATFSEMKWFIKQEVAGETGFDDLAALTQVKLPVRPKLEVARNYWDEMGRGRENGMHGPLLDHLAREMGVHGSPISEIVPESLALGNILLGLAINRRYAYHAVGALGIVELTAPDRSLRVYQGLKRLGLSPEAQRYYLLHSTLDKKHSAAWNSEVIEPLVAEDPSVATAIAEGALMRLRAGARCFAKYRQVLGFNGSH